MKRSTQMILTTHTGSLPRPPELIPMLISRSEDKPVDRSTFEAAIKHGVVEAVKHQGQAGIDVINDGEQSKISYAGYLKDRLSGFELEPVGTPGAPSREARDFPEYYARRAQLGQARRACCVGPVAWKDFSEVQRDIDNLRAATKGARAQEVFMTSPSPEVASRFQPNRYYKTTNEYEHAMAEVMKREYKAIADAGFLLQIDCPLGVRQVLDYEVQKFRAAWEQHIETINQSTKDLQPGQMRIHVCWGADEAPHHLDVELKDILSPLLKVRADGITVVGANGRHEHEWKVWKDVKVPEGKVIVPGVIDSTCNFIEHPEAVAERIIRYANVLGRENVIAGVDCGFATGVRSTPPAVDPKIAWAKLKTLAEGAALASKELWRR